MMLIDTSVWVEFFRRRGYPPAKRRVAELLERDEAGFTCPTLFELVSGARKAELPIILQTLALAVRFEFRPDFWIPAARLESRLRQAGITVPRDDIFVAAAAIGHSQVLLCRDRHFDLIRRHSDGQLRIEQIDPALPANQ
jgi:predicted nucleic acid-binding protein